MEASTENIINFMNDRAKKKLEKLSIIRASLRERILTDKILLESQTTFSAEFDGYGDSGSVYADVGDEEINQFLTLAVETFVDFDWYNNEGGGGNITWDVISDKIIINGYFNVVQQVNALDEAEF
jgi:hypothetical protein